MHHFSSDFLHHSSSQKNGVQRRVALHTLHGILIYLLPPLAILPGPLFNGDTFTHGALLWISTRTVARGSVHIHTKH